MISQQLLILLLPAVSALRMSVHRNIQKTSVWGDEETYAQYLTCAGKTYLLSRIAPPGGFKLAHSKGWGTRIRVLEGDALKHAGTWPTPMSHNMAALCVNNQFFIMGGQYRDEGAKNNWAHFAGIRTALIPDLANLEQAVNAPVTISGKPKENACIEGRATFKSCEYDGKIGLHQNKGTTYAYVRANTGDDKRWVQVTQSDDLKTWSNFQPIEIDGLPKEVSNTNIYFFQVEDWNSTHKVGIFPAVLPHASGLFTTFSTDMMKWSAPHLLRHLTPVKYAAISSAESEDESEPASRVGEFPVALLNGKLLIMKRMESKTGKFHEAFYISTQPLTENANLEEFTKWEISIEKGEH